MQHEFFHVTHLLMPLSSHAGGIYSLRITFSERYPDKPPRVRFTSEVFHPNGKLVSVRLFLPVQPPAVVRSCTYATVAAASCTWCVPPPFPSTPQCTVMALCA